MAITTLPPAPLRTDTPANFVTKADAIMAALPLFISDSNALAAGLTSIAAGGAIALPYTFKAVTTDSDPGLGLLRFNSSTQNATSIIRFDNQTVLGQDVSSLIDTFDDSSSAVKGHLRIVKVGDATKWTIFTVSSVAAPSGYRNVVAAPLLFSTTNPFTDGDSVVVYFQRTGDIGSQGTLNRRYFGAGSTATAVNIDNYDMVAYTGITGSFTIPVPTGTLSQGRSLMMVVTDNGTARALAYTGGAGGLNAGSDLPAPSSTQVGKYLYLGWIYNGTAGRWDLVSVLFV